MSLRRRYDGDVAADATDIVDIAALITLP